MKRERILDILICAEIIMMAITMVMTYYLELMTRATGTLILGLLFVMIVLSGLYRLSKARGVSFRSGCELFAQELKYKFKYERGRLIIRWASLIAGLVSFFAYVYYMSMVFGLTAMVSCLIILFILLHEKNYCPPKPGEKPFRFIVSFLSVLLGVCAMCLYWPNAIASYLQGFTILWSRGFHAVALIWGVLLISFSIWASYKLLLFLMLKGVSSQIDLLLENSRAVEMLEDVEVRLAPVSSPISVVWQGRKLLFLPPYMIPRAGHDGFVLTADERRAILEHEVVHLDLDGEARWHELKRREALKALLLAIVIVVGWEPILYLTLIMGLLIGAPLDLGLAGLWKAFSTIPKALSIIIEWCAELSVAAVALWLGFSGLMLASLGIIGSVYAVRFREARADFLAALRTGDPDAYERALRKAYQVRGSPVGSGPLMALCLAPVGGQEELEHGEEGLTELSLKEVARTRLADVLWFPKNLHPPLQGRLFVVRIAKALLSHGLRLEFRRSLEEVDYIRFSPNMEDLPRLKCLLQSMEELCRSKGRFTLRELEDVMAQKGFQFSYSELFGALVFLEDRGIAVVRP